MQWKISTKERRIIGSSGSGRRITMASPSTPSKRLLLFDRRYGWVLDEWKEPSQEALSGGRGMFCVIPLANATLKKASELFVLVARVKL
ncbi:uncharacterized protein LOC127256974 isoform X2 [Andrographis paniculata]|uniref:uncharacterized protein LOC127256974 isoform X2 n=1 Tax=Andrographis paniculata TaxID=175694 RepID=UPI0021E703EB|nr:uncharacterized protein LOC127256974 isoform X2 [Andrographis paniculata]